MLIGITGSQSGTTRFQIEEFKKILKLKECSELVMGDCIGSDIQLAVTAVIEGVNTFTVHPPSDNRKRAFFADPQKRLLYNRIHTPYIDCLINDREIKVRWMPIETYLERNKRIVDSVPLLIATPKEFKHTVRSGTWATIRYCWKIKKDIIIIPPIERPEDGSN